MQSAYPLDYDVLKNSATILRSFAVDYRLSASHPYQAENPFPAALLDAISGYHYLIKLGFRSENIILSGESSGANLALALCRYLIQNPAPNLIPIGGLLLLSVWGNLSAHTTPSSSRIVNKKSDILPLDYLTTGVGFYGATSYRGSAFSDDELKPNEYISPASPYLTQTDGMFKAFPKTYILAGDAEALLDDSTIIAERMKIDNPSDGWITLDVAEDGVHMFPAFTWAEPERSEALLRLGRWLDQKG